MHIMETATLAYDQGLGGKGARAKKTGGQSGQGGRQIDHIECDRPKKACQGKHRGCIATSRKGNPQHLGRCGYLCIIHDICRNADR